MPDGPSPPLDSIAVLIQRVREGDKDSLERLIQRHLAPLRRTSAAGCPGGRGTCPTPTIWSRTPSCGRFQKWTPSKFGAPGRCRHICGRR